MYDTSIPIIFVVCDHQYIKYLNCFLSSLHKNVHQKQVYVHFINTSKDIVSNITHKFPFVKDYGVENIELNNKNTKTALPPFSPLRHTNRMFANCTKSGFGKLYSEKQAYCANIRFKLIPTLLEKHNCNLIYIDVDNIINNNIAELYDELIDYDVLTVPCQENHPLISTTLFCIKNTNNARSIFHKIWEKIEPNITDWGIDHIAMNTIIPYNNILTKQLPPRYYDEQYKPDSCIWINHLTMYGMSDKYERVVNEIYPDTNPVL